jgi:hypothetical protein
MLMMSVKTWSLVVRELQISMSVVDPKVLRRIFGHKREEVTEESK